jgi:hypothetical protein
MAQGNPYGRSGGNWPTHTKLRALVNSGRTYDEIAQIVFETEPGWEKPPSRSGVKKKLDALGFAPRNKSHRELLPWKIRPEHQTAELRHMLEAESRRRQLAPGEQLSDADRSLIRGLESYLWGRGGKQTAMVVSYHPEVGFSLVPREDCDEDIIRDPRADVYSDPDEATGASLQGSTARARTARSASGVSAAQRPTYATE